MADINPIQTAKDSLPVIANWGSSIFSMVTWLIVIVVLMGLSAGIIIWFIYRSRYNIKINIFEQIDNHGNWIPTKRDKACELRFDSMGTRLIYFKRLKRYEPYPNKASGLRTYFYKQFADGTLENFTFHDDMEDEEIKQKEMNKAMLYHHTGIRKGLKERYDKMNWIKEYMPLIVSVTVMIIGGIMMWLLFQQWINLAKVTNDGVKTSGEVMELAKQILQSIDNIKYGSGYTYVNGTG